MDDNHPRDRRLISLQEGAERIGLDTTTLRRYITKGKITGYRIGPKIIRVDVAEIDALAQPIPVKTPVERCWPPRAIAADGWTA